ncbi:hypothetical protein LTR84_007989 [Exophiala bonariae]|uniref:Uncharacterized protein n=1 Tax=Exophiala bonariae TaxID=1690606 RepID=A0AAV9NLL8_9EURO|nr:hypothetical protein LTR84_007989 [Exophiala bonariae]
MHHAGNPDATKLQKFYAPLCTRWPVLTSIMVALLACVVVLEIGLQIGLSLEEKAEHQIQVRRLRRQIENTSVRVTSAVKPAVSSSTSTTKGVIPGPSSISTPYAGVSSGTTQSWVDWNESPDAYVDPRTSSARVTSSRQEPTETLTNQNKPEYYANPQSTSIRITSKSPVNKPTSAFVAPATTQNADHFVFSDYESSLYAQPSTTDPDKSSPVTKSEDPSAIGGSDKSLSTSSKDVSRIIQAYNPPSSGDVMNPSVVTTQSSYGSNGLGNTQRTSLSTLIASLPISGSLAEDLQSHSYALIITTKLVSDLSGHVFTFISTATSRFPEPTNSEQVGPIEPVPTITVDGQSPDEVELGLTISGFEYFRAMYLPIVVAVLLKLGWNVVFAATKMMEPFYLLSKEGGASAQDSLVADYLISSLSLEGLRNLFVGHPVVVLASLTYICISTLPSLATQATTIKAIGTCYSETGQTHCHPMWELSITYARVLQVVLCVTTLLILAMMVLSLRRQSGVFSNPASIATMASLLNNDDFISEIRTLPQSPSRSSVLHALGRTQFTLAHHRAACGHMRYGIVKAEATNQKQEYSVPSKPLERRKPTSHDETGSLSQKLFVDVVFLLAILALLSIIVAYYLVHGDTPFNNFFNHSPLRSLVLTLTASILDGHWKQLEHEVRLLTPYRRLSRGAARPDVSILITQNATAITSFFPALRQGNFFHAAIAFVAILSDVLIVVIGGVPFSSAQFHMDFVVCTYISWIILAIMAMMVLALFRWRAQNERMMSSQNPNTLLAVCQLLCNRNNSVRDQMTGTEKMKGSARDRMVRRSSVRYCAGWITEEDGSRRWAVEIQKSPKLEASQT